MRCKTLVGIFEMMNGGEKERIFRAVIAEFTAYWVFASLVLLGAGKLNPAKFMSNMS